MIDKNGSTGRASVPTGVAKFNWGAFFFPVIWPFVYQLRGWAAVALLSGVIVQFLGLRLSEQSPLSAILIANGVALTVETGLRIYYGLKITEAYWERYPDRMTPEDYIRRQPRWIVVGMGFFAATIIINALILSDALG